MTDQHHLATTLLAHRQAAELGPDPKHLQGAQLKPHPPDFLWWTIVHQGHAPLPSCAQIATECLEGRLVVGDVEVARHREGELSEARAWHGGGGNPDNTVGVRVRQRRDQARDQTVDGSTSR